MNENMSFDSDKTMIGGTPGGEATQLVMANPNATQFAANVECPVCHTQNPPSETYCIDCGFMLTSAPVGVCDVPIVSNCGKLVSTDGAFEFPLNPGENSVGRESADVLLNYNTVSRKHARMLIENGSAFVEDMGSTNGTYVDGGKIEQGQKVELKDGRDVTFGSVTFKYTAAEIVEQKPAEDAPVDDVEVDAAEVVQEVQGEPQAEIAEDVADEAAAVGRLETKDGSMSFKLADGLNTIGRREGANTIVVPDPYCSGRHADLSVANGEIIITDLGSTNGTFVNGVKLEPNSPRQLQLGDDLTIGRPVFRLEVGDV